MTLWRTAVRDVVIAIFLVATIAILVVAQVYSESVEREIAAQNAYAIAKDLERTERLDPESIQDAIRYWQNRLSREHWRVYVDSPRVLVEKKSEGIGVSGMSNSGQWVRGVAPFEGANGESGRVEVEIQQSVLGWYLVWLSAMVLVIGFVVVVFDRISRYSEKYVSESLGRMLTATSGHAPGNTEPVERGWFHWVRPILMPRESLQIVKDFQKLIEDTYRIKKEAREKQKRLEMQEDLHKQITHDIRSPLGNISNCAEWTMEEIRRGRIIDAVEPVQKIIDECNSTSRYLENELEMSKGGAVGCEPFNLVRAIEEELIDSKRSDIKDYPYIVHVDPSIPGYINSVQTFVVSGVRNLLTNAKKAMPDGGRIHVCIRLGTGVDENRVLVDVKDEGGGVAEEEKQRIFRAKRESGKVYMMIEFSQSKKGPGLGVGLQLVNQNLERIGGEIRLIDEETPLGGAWFQVMIPGGWIESENDVPKEERGSDEADTRVLIKMGSSSRAREIAANVSRVPGAVAVIERRGCAAGYGEVVSERRGCAEGNGEVVIRERPYAASDDVYPDAYGAVIYLCRPDTTGEMHLQGWVTQMEVSLAIQRMQERRHRTEVTGEESSEMAAGDSLPISQERYLLLVDDASINTEAMRKMMESRYPESNDRILEADGGRQAIDLAREYAGMIGGAIIDYQMPEDMDGVACARGVAEYNPGVVLAIITGNAAVVPQEEADAANIRWILSRGSRNMDLIDRIVHDSIGSDPVQSKAEIPAPSREAIREFMEERIQRIESAHAEGDGSRILRETHTAIGTLKSMGFQSESEWFIEVEDAARSGDWQLIESRLEEAAKEDGIRNRCH